MSRKRFKLSGLWEGEQMDTVRVKAEGKLLHSSEDEQMAEDNVELCAAEHFWIG